MSVLFIPVSVNEIPEPIGTITVLSVPDAVKLLIETLVSMVTILFKPVISKLFIWLPLSTVTVLFRPDNFKSNNSFSFTDTVEPMPEISNSRMSSFSLSPDDEHPMTSERQNVASVSNGNFFIMFPLIMTVKKISLSVFLKHSSVLKTNTYI